jgi:hypothetical protein
VEFDVGVVAADLNVYMSLFQAAFTPRLDGVVQADFIGVTALDMHVAHSQAHVQHAASHEVTNLIVCFFVVPVVRSGTKGYQEKTYKDRLVERG